LPATLVTPVAPKKSDNKVAPPAIAAKAPAKGKAASAATAEQNAKKAFDTLNTAFARKNQVIAGAIIGYTNVDRGAYKVVWGRVYHEGVPGAVSRTSELNRKSICNSWCNADPVKNAEGKGLPLFQYNGRNWTCYMVSGTGANKVLYYTSEDRLYDLYVEEGGNLLGIAVVDCSTPAKRKKMETGYTVVISDILGKALTF
jgi:hypothetical protein